ncbi:MAG: S41 family peptidase [Burkholderiaceae bacterium]
MKTKALHLGLISAGAVAGILVSVGMTALAQKETPTKLPLTELRQFTDVFGAIKANYVEPVTDGQLITEAITGMLAGLDPHSTYLDTEAFRELQVGTQGQFGGLGIEVGVEDGFIKVVAPIEDTPAARAGIKAGDLIVKIDEKPTKGMSLADAVKLMRGKPKTSIVLTVSRKDVDGPLVIEIIRDVIQVRSVRWKTIEPGYGYIRITQFQEHTVANLVRGLTELAEQGMKKGLVLDLRNDPGGLLHGAVGVSAAFLPPRVTVVSTNGRTRDAQRDYLATAEDYMRGSRSDLLADLPEIAKTIPMVVLVNGGSASASEIVAGALQDHGRAKVLGTQTFGKGSVQSILPLTNNTAIKLTTARYYTPKGRSIQAKGITPDLKVEETPEGDINQFRVREVDLSGHLSNDKEKEAEIRRPSATQAAAARQKPIVYGSEDDYQLQQAVNLLKGKPVVVAKHSQDEVPAQTDTR